MHEPYSFKNMYTVIKYRKIPFFIVFFIVTFVTYAFLYAVDFYPEPKDTVATQSTEKEEDKTATTVKEIKEIEPIVVSTKPVKIVFESLDREIVVLNPESRDIADLDAALLNGVVRHPDSADFSKKGNVFILGHSSYLPNVLNKNFQAFNGIQKLVWGDLIRLESKDTVYTYRVQKTYQAKASDVTVPATPGKAMLTLATCNSFGSKDDRFMVEAVLIDEKPL